MVTLPSLTEIQSARERIADMAIRSPLIRYAGPAPGNTEIYLKLECLQPYGSFKMRAGANAIRSLPSECLDRGIATASAGNFAQGLAAAAAQLGVTVTVYAPRSAARKKLEALADLGAVVETMSFDDWWSVMENHGQAGDPATFIHPVADDHVIAGNATIGLEIAEDLPDVNAVLVPFGGGGLLSGIGAALGATQSPARILGCESEAATPLAAALTSGDAVPVDFNRSTFINGIGSTSVLAEMWPLVETIADGSVTVTIDAVKDALRALVHHHGIIAEGAGAVSLAAALSGKVGDGRTVCIISGSNIDVDVLCGILTASDA